MGAPPSGLPGNSVGLIDAAGERAGAPVTVGSPDGPGQDAVTCQILNEEWEHRLYAERDLDALRAHST